MGALHGSRTRTAVICALALLLAGGQASAGWGFKPTVDLEVSALGYYDDAGDGLLHAHPIGIFDASTRDLLVETNVQQQGPLDVGYRWASIPPLVLKAGKTYRVVTYSINPHDPEPKNVTGVVWQPEIVHVGNYFDDTPTGLEYPNADDAFYMTANLKFRPLSVASPTP